MSSETGEALHWGRRNTVIFTDPGLDDALALIWLLMRDEIRVDALVAVAGNNTAQQCLANLRYLIETVGRTDLPVYHTLDMPQSYRVDPEIHGSDGLGGLAQRRTTNASSEGHSLPLSSYSPPIGEALHMLSMSPNTVAADFIRTHRSHIESLTLMGGVHHIKGNFTGGQEFNFGHDPFATEALLAESACPVRIIPLDVTLGYALEKADVEMLSGQAHGPCAEAFVSLARRYAQLARARGKSAFAHDLTAAIAMVCPELFTWAVGTLVGAIPKIELQTVRDSIGAGVAEGRFSVATAVKDKDALTHAIASTIVR